MKILVLNGSPRKGNTVAAINAFAKSVKENDQVEVVDTYKLKVGPCMGCNACQCSLGCVAKDDTNMIVDKIVEADLVVFASPVYWWGITAQLKLVLDKCYCRGAALKGKMAGVIIVGAEDVEGVQYNLIKTQFQCIAEYLQWDIKFHLSFSAMMKDDLSGNSEAMAELEACGAAL